MRRFYEEFHTPENLNTQMAVLYDDYPSTLVVGSLGRACVYHQVSQNPFYEFSARGENPLYQIHPIYAAYHDGPTARDIDVIGIPHEDAAGRLPFWIDATSYSNSNALLEQNGESWYLSDNHGYLEPIYPDVMEPQDSRTIFGIHCKTLKPETQLALLMVRGELRPKDRLPYMLLKSTISQLGKRNRLRPSLLDPFFDLHNQNKKTKLLAGI